MNKVLGRVCLGIVLVAGAICVGEEPSTTGRLLIGYPDTVWSEQSLSEKFQRSRECQAVEVLPLAVAKQQGLFTKHGVAVQFRAVPATARAPLLEHDVLFGYPFRDFVDPKASPEQIRFMFPFAMTKDGDTLRALVVKKQAGIKDWVDFKGTGIAVSSPLEVTFFWDYVVPKVGLRSNEIKWDVLMGPRSVAGFPTNAELQAFYCDKATMRELMRDSPDEFAVFASNLETQFIGNPCYGGCVGVNWARCREKLEVLTGLVQALDDAIEKIRTNPTESVGAVSTLFKGLDEKSVAELGVCWFQKSSETCDFKALERQFRKNLEPYYWRPSLPSSSAAADHSSNGAAEDSDREQLEALFPIRKGGKWGYLNRQGRMVIEPVYDEALEFHDGRAPVQVGEKWGYIDCHGVLVIAAQYAMAGRFSAGLAAVIRPRDVRWPMRVGHIDTMGKVVIEPEFYGGVEDADFRDGRALVCPKGLPIIGAFRLRYGYIDRSGKFAIAPQFEMAMPFSDGLAKVWTGEKAMYIDTAGNVVIDVTLYMYTGDFSEGLASVAEPAERGGKIGFINREGRLVVATAYDRVDEFSEGLAAVAVGWNHPSFVPKGMNYVPAKWGYIDKTGTVVISPQYWWVGPFSEGLAFVELEEGGKNGYIDREGKIVVRPQFDSVRSFQHGLARVTVGDRWEEYETPTGKGRRLVPGKMGYINKVGDYVWGPTD